MMEPALRELGLMLIAGAVMVLLTRRVYMPSIVAYIFAGLFLGPLTGLVSEQESVRRIADAGIALLLFLVGLELSLRKLRDIGRTAVIAGGGQIIIAAAGGAVIAWLFGYAAMEITFIAAALAFSSTIVPVKLLSQKNQLSSLHGRVAVGISLVQNLLVIVVLTFLTGLGDPEGLSGVEILRGLGLAFGGMLLLLAGALLSARFVLPPLFNWMGPSQEGLLIWSLCWCFLFVLIAEAFNLSPEIGAFLAGVSLAQLRFNEDLRRRVNPLMNLFVAVFFISLGVSMELGSAAEQWLPGLVISVFVLVAELVFFLWIMIRLGYGDRTGWMTGAAVAQISEFSLVLAALGVSMGYIGAPILSVVAIVATVTMAVTAYLILYSERIYDWLLERRILGRWPVRNAALDVHEEHSSGHIIVVGMNALGRRIVDRLVALGEDVLAVDTSPGNLEGLTCRVMLGNAEHVGFLEEAGMRDAKLLVSTLQIEETNQLLAYWGRLFGVPTSIHAFDNSLADDLLNAGATHVILSKAAGTRRIADAFRSAGIFA
jgi:Kef-type K+ transport system membrane component KefB